MTDDAILRAAAEPPLLVLAGDDVAILPAPHGPGVTAYGTVLRHVGDRVTVQLDGAARTVDCRRVVPGPWPVRARREARG